MEKPRPLKKPRVFYGYWIVAVTFLCLFITSGCIFFTFSLFIKPLQAELGWGRGEIMAAFTVNYLIAGATSPFVGRMIGRYEARKVIAAGAIIVGLGFVALSLTNSLWHLYLGYAIAGAGSTAMGHVPSSTIVSFWFKKRRGTAIGIMSTGIGAGGFALSPLIGGLLIPSFGWRATYLISAVLTWALIIPLVLLVIKTKPEDVGLYPDGEQAPETAAAAEASLLTTRGATLRMALSTSALWLIAASFLTGNFSLSGLVHNQVPYLEDIGFPIATAAGALGIIGLGSLIGKFGFGWLCDRIPAKYAWSMGLFLLLASIAILMNVKPTSPLATIWLYAAIMGLSCGSWLPTMSMLISTNFGLAAYGTIFGVVSFAFYVGGATGPLMAGYMYDVTGTYRWAFIIFLALCAVAIPLILAVRRPKQL